jgi:hypothetical protein
MNVLDLMVPESYQQEEFDRWTMPGDGAVGLLLVPAFVAADRRMDMPAAVRVVGVTPKALCVRLLRQHGVKTWIPKSQARGFAPRRSTTP